MFDFSAEVVWASICSEYMYHFNTDINYIKDAFYECQIILFKPLPKHLNELKNGLISSIPHY